MARRPKRSLLRPDPPAAATREQGRNPDIDWRNENESLEAPNRIRWFSAHDYTTSDDTLHTPKAEDKPGIGAASARQEPDSAPDRDTVAAPRKPRNRTTPHERSSRPRRRSRPRARRHAPARARRSRSAR